MGPSSGGRTGTAGDPNAPAMSLPVLLAVDEDRVALDELEAQLVQRYSGDYRVECLADPDEAMRMLAALAAGGEDVEIVME